MRLSSNIYLHYCRSTSVELWIKGADKEGERERERGEERREKRKEHSDSVMSVLYSPFTHLFVVCFFFFSPVPSLFGCCLECCFLGVESSLRKGLTLQNQEKNTKNSSG